MGETNFRTSVVPLSATAMRPGIGLAVFTDDVSSAYA